MMDRVKLVHVARSPGLGHRLRSVNEILTPMPAASMLILSASARLALRGGPRGIDCPDDDLSWRFLGADLIVYSIKDVVPIRADRPLNIHIQDRAYVRHLLDHRPRVALKHGSGEGASIQTDPS
jgi:hypothetical protein